MNDKEVEELQKEIKVLKNEIKATLADIREYLLTNVENPFPVDMTGGATAANRSVDRLLQAAELGYVPSAPPQQVEQGFGPGGPAAATPAQTLVLGGSPSATGAEVLRSAAAEPQMASTPSGTGTQPVAQAPQGDVASPGPKPADKGRGNGHAAREQLASTEMLEEEATSRREAEAEGGRRDARADLVTVAMLVSWAEDGARRVGKDRLKVIVDVYGSMGGLNDQIRDVLLKLISLDDSHVPPVQASLRECMRVLVDLDNMVWRSRFDKGRAALLSIFQG